MLGDSLVWPFESLRMDRYMARVKKDKVKATPELVKLWGTPSGRTMVALVWFFNLLCMTAVCLSLTFYSS